MPDYTLPQSTYYSPYMPTQNPQFPATDVYGVNYSSLNPIIPGNYTNPNTGYWSGQQYIAPGGTDAANTLYGAYSNVTPDQISQYGTAQDAGLLNMIRATGQSVLANNYFQTPGYQLLFGSNYAQMDPSLSPTQRFEHSPGYQYAVEKALKQAQQQGAARGLLESGQMQRELVDRSQQMAMQDYYNWWDRLSGNYENYQNRLAQLAGGPTGSNYAISTGQNEAGIAQNTGSNLASLYGNQGAAGMGAYMNTGAAMSNNVMQAAALQAQIEAANAAAKGQQQSAMMGMAGQALGLLGGMF